MPFSLDVADFAVRPGETVFLAGASGSGKSTLLSLIAGITNARKGRVEVDGRDLGRMAGPRRDRFRADRIGIIFQMFNLLPYATGLENILLPLAFAPERKARLDDPKAAALDLAEGLGLTSDLLTLAQAHTLSIGQQQRVAAARALIGGPQLVIADEPTSALDAETQLAFIDLLLARVAAAGATLLMVSHDERLKGRFDRALRLEDVAVTRKAGR